MFVCSFWFPWIFECTFRHSINGWPHAMRTFSLGHCLCFHPRRSNCPQILPFWAIIGWFIYRNQRMGVRLPKEKVIEGLCPWVDDALLPFHFPWSSLQFRPRQRTLPTQKLLSIFIIQIYSPISGLFLQKCSISQTTLLPRIPVHSPSNNIVLLHLNSSMAHFIHLRASNVGIQINNWTIWIMVRMGWSFPII